MRARKRRRKFFEEQKRKRGKEEAAFNRAQKGQDGEQGDKQVRRRSLLEEQKRKRLSERTRGYKGTSKQGGGGEMKDREKEAEGGPFDLIYKGRSKVVT